ncbi:hypothetical protein L1887_31779 [Cichorium endivia]|nr:hypothetical protein L1887_31779 [Cichorium endivia]
MTSISSARLNAYDLLFSMAIRYLISIHKGFCFRRGISSPITDRTERLLLEERDLSVTPKEGLKMIGQPRHPLIGYLCLWVLAVLGLRQSPYQVLKKPDDASRLLKFAFGRSKCRGHLGTNEPACVLMRFLLDVVAGVYYILVLLRVAQGQKNL